MTSSIEIDNMGETIEIVIFSLVILFLVGLWFGAGFWFAHRWFA
jgi:hypothetical protein